MWRALILKQTVCGEKLLKSKVRSCVMQTVPKWMANQSEAAFRFLRLGGNVLK